MAGRVQVLVKAIHAFTAAGARLFKVSLIQHDGQFILPAPIPCAGLEGDQGEGGISPCFLHIHREQRSPPVGCTGTDHGMTLLQLIVAILNDPAEPGFEEPPLALDQKFMLADLSGT